MPWIMPEGNNWGSARVNNEHAIKNGLTYTLLAKTVRDTYEWWYSDALTDERRAKFEENAKSVLVREAEILKAWKNR